MELVPKEGSHSVGHDQNILGINTYKKKRIDHVLKHFKIASVVDQKNDEFFFNFRLTFYQMGRHLESAKSFQWALKLSSKKKEF